MEISPDFTRQKTQLHSGSEEESTDSQIPLKHPIEYSDLEAEFTTGTWQDKSRNSRGGYSLNGKCCIVYQSGTRDGREKNRPGKKGELEKEASSNPLRALRLLTNFTHLSEAPEISLPTAK